MLSRTTVVRGGAWINQGSNKYDNDSPMKGVMGNWNTSKQEKREKTWGNMDDGKVSSWKRKALREAKLLKRDDEYWDVAPSEFKTESVMMKATGAGFNSMYEDKNKRSTAISEELAQSRFKPPITSRTRTSASPTSLQDLYSNVPELSLLSPFSHNTTSKRKQPPPQYREDTVLHPEVKKYSKTPFPMSKRATNAWPPSNYNPKKDQKFETRIP